MDEFVKAYLTKNYVIEESELIEGGHDIVCKCERYKKDYLAYELAAVFSITEKKAKQYVQDWAIELIADVDLEKYWYTSPFLGVPGSMFGSPTMSVWRAPGIYTNGVVS